MRHKSPSTLVIFTAFQAYADGLDNLRNNGKVAEQLSLAGLRYSVVELADAGVLSIPGFCVYLSQNPACFAFESEQAVVYALARLYNQSSVRVVSPERTVYSEALLPNRETSVHPEGLAEFHDKLPEGYTGGEYVRFAGGAVLVVKA